MTNQTQESKLKTILLGTPEQRKARNEEMQQAIVNSSTVGHIARTFLQPGYVFRRAVFTEEPLANKAVRLFIGAYVTALQGAATYVIANKLGEYFTQ